MSSAERHRELRSRFEERPREACVYLLRSSVSGRILVGSTTDLASLRNRIAFGRATGSAGVLDLRLHADARANGVASFELEVLDTLDLRPEMTPAEVAADLAALEALWRDKLADRPQY